MFISEFARKHNTTVDTVKYYIKLGLLTPNKKNNWYLFTDREVDELQNIVELKELGLSLDAIVKIKQLHETKCGTKDQLAANHQVLLTELEETDKQIALLLDRKTKLTEMIQQLSHKIEDSSD